MHMQIMHSIGNLLGPRNHPVYGNCVLLILEQIEKRSVRTELHNYAIARRFLRTDTLELNNVGMIEFSKVPNIGFFQFRDFLHSYRLIVEHSRKYRPLSTATEECEIGNLVKWNFPVICKNKSGLDIAKRKIK